MPRTDADLVRAALDRPGSEAESAFEQLVERWKVRVVRFAWSRLRDEHEAEDVAIEVFLRAWRGLRDLRDPDQFGAWIYRIAVNRVRSVLEKRGRRPSMSLIEETLQSRDALAGSPGVRADLAATLARLPDPLARALRDKYEGNLTYAEIAERESISVHTVKDRLRAAREHLERLLQSSGYLTEYGPTGGGPAAAPSPEPSDGIGGGPGGLRGDGTDTFPGDWRTRGA